LHHTPTLPIQQDPKPKKPSTYLHPRHKTTKVVITKKSRGGAEWRGKYGKKTISQKKVQESK
jgi:hypothetical protein